LSLTLLSPLGALLVLVAVVPLAAVTLGARRVAAACRVLGLDPDIRTTRGRAFAAVIAAALVAAAAAQPAIRTERTQKTRTDVQAMVVVDVSRSMRASAAPGSPTRFARAQRLATQIRDGLPEVPTGVASLTDRVLPHLFPTPDRAVFAETVQRALTPERPAPAEPAVQATSLAALAAVHSANIFENAAQRRLLVVLTDGDSRPFDAQTVARALTSGHIGLVLVRIGSTSERVFSGGRAEPRYVPDQLALRVVDSLAAAAGGSAVGEEDTAAAVRGARDYLGSGPTGNRGRGERLIPLGPLLALLALVPLGFLVRAPGFRRVALAE
jgi:VWA domain-containing protein